MNLRSTWKATAVGIAVLMVASASVVLADDISNNLDGTIDATLESTSLTAGGANGSVQLFVQPRNLDGKNGCNLTAATTLVVSVSSSTASVVSASPSSITFTSCGDTPTITLTPLTVGSSTISVSQTSNSTGGTFNFAPASFTVNVGAGVDPCDSVAAPAAPVFATTGADNNGLNGWFVTVPTVSATSSTAGATITYSTDGTTFSATAPTLGEGTTTVIAKATSATCNKTSISSETFNVDTVAPTVNPASVTNTTWRNSDLSQAFTSTDATSGLADATNDASFTLTASAESADGSTPTVATRTVYDLAGNSTTRSVSALIDLTGPTISDTGATPSLPDGLNGWYVSAVSNGFSASDSLSGLDATCAAAFPKSVSTGTNEGNSISVSSGACADTAGNSNPGISSATFMIDLTNPTIGHTVSPTNPDGSNGWYVTAPTVTFNCSDATSDVASCVVDGSSPASASVTLGESSSSQTVSGTATDNAGRTGIDSATGLYVDLSNPTNIAFTGGSIVDGSSYYFGFVPAGPSGCTANDAISGLASCGVTGGGTTVGAHSYTATATDNAGRQTTATISYTVLAWTLNGFYQPVDMNGVYNLVKGGSTVPLKFEIFAGSTELTDTSNVLSLRYQSVTCINSLPTDAVETTATGGTSLRYDATGGQFIYNWKTPTAIGCYRVTMTTLDGSTLVALFKTK